MDKIRKGEDIKVEAIKFFPHDSRNCAICESGVATVRTPNVNIKLFHSEFNKIGMVHMKSSNFRSYYKPITCDTGVCVSMSISILEDMTWKLYVCNNEVDKNSESFVDFPKTLSNDSIEEFCNKLSDVQICTGNLGYEDVINAKSDIKEPFIAKDGSQKGWAESFPGGIKLRKGQSNVERSVDCAFIVREGSLCNGCKPEPLAKCHKRLMHWHPLIIPWCLSIDLTSPAAYEQMASKRNKLLVSPHMNTLKDYINFTKTYWLF